MLKRTPLFAAHQKLGASGLRLPGQSIGVTISIGAAAAQADDSAETLVKRADQALYEAKRLGRNRVCAG